MSLIVTVTDAGRAALVAANHAGTNAVTIASVGLSETEVAPTTAMTALPDELKQIATISGATTAFDTIHVTIKDETGDVYSMRSFGLYLSDGTLFALYGQADPILEKSAVALLLLSIDVQFADVLADAITFGDASFINPSATTDAQGVVELATPAETQAGLDALRAVTPVGLLSAFTNWLASFSVWRASNDGAGSGLDADLLDGLDSTAFVRTTASATTDARGIVELATAAETQTGADAARAVTPSGLLSAFTGWLSSFAVWRASNDGAGSGLDADLLDGLDSTAFVRTTASATTDARGIVELATAAETQTGADGTRAVTPMGALSAFTGWLASFGVWRASNDGAGSGLDADLLDGQQGSWFTDIVARLGFTPVQQGGGSGQLANKIYIGWSGSRLKAQVDVTDQGNLLTDAALLGIDGAGSGLDADLLDGHDSGYFLPASSYSAPDVKAKMLTQDGAGSGLDADLLDGLDSSALVQKVNIMTDLAAAMNSAGGGGALPAYQFEIGDYLVQMGWAMTVGANQTEWVAFPRNFSEPPWALAGRRTSGPVANSDSGGGIEGSPAVNGMTVRNTTAGSTIDIPWVAVGKK
ncbi:MAG: hypothetical protein ACTHLA_01560 [Asticcacaulis sp.]|uniref:hypothetical protein n=1 Tax=Asticcacaulis sp. TaxID=1872648 RepID=UPI003F7C7C97